jgi:hypothetical protein
MVLLKLGKILGLGHIMHTQNSKQQQHQAEQSITTAIFITVETGPLGSNSPLHENRAGSK